MKKKTSFILSLAIYALFVALIPLNCFPDSIVLASTPGTSQPLPSLPIDSILVFLGVVTSSGTTIAIAWLQHRWNKTPKHRFQHYDKK